jgi:DNA-binding NarL/FixJ family response regulator
VTKLIRILIADDHPVIREALSRFLDSQEDMTVVGKAADGIEAVEMAHSLKPRLVLMDFEMPHKKGAEATSEILQENPALVVIGYSMHDEGPITQAMAVAGAATHVSKHRDNADLLSAIRDHLT